ncbi:MAG: hypothetical protein OEW34_11950, partial [Burkholderiaceae bacterium]|nr:hypothetical protein [Burkholderiaceae bacterium]
MEPDRQAMGLGRVRARRLGVLASALALAASAWAQPLVGSTIYSCVANGRTYSGDRPPPECANSDLRELNKDGSVRRVIPRPLTVEEQRARAAEVKKRIDEEERALAQRRRDRSLLEAYASEEEIEAARVKALDTSNEVIRRSQARLDRMEAERRRLDEESEFFKKRDLPDTIKRSYANNEQERAAELKIVSEALLETQRINERFEAEKKRFRELISQGARPVQRNPEPDILLDP